MTSVVFRSARGICLQRWYSAAAAVPLTTPIETNTPAQGTRPAPEEVKVSKVNGFAVASLENHSSLSNVSVFMRAGSRYETYDQQGLTHLLRNCAFLGNGDRSAFRIARETDMIGGSLNVTSTREHLIYSSNFIRGNMTQIMDTLGSVICRPQFKPWEVDDKKYTLPLDLTQMEAAPTSVVLENLHRVAYRNALCNPLYCPACNASKFTSDDLQDYMSNHFNPEGTVVLGVGVNHDELVRCVENSFSSDNTDMGSQTIQAEYVGGVIILPYNYPNTGAAVVRKGASLKGAQADLLAAGVLQHLLGAEPQGYIKWGSNTCARLSKAAALATDSYFNVAALNLNYSDSGLFGIFLLCAPNDSEKLLKATMKEFSAVARGEITDEDISRAKNQLKTRYLMNTEAQCALVEDIASQVDLKGAYSPTSETLSQVDRITRDDIVRFACGVFATKASYVSHGNLSSTPRLDQLLAEVSLK